MHKIHAKEFTLEDFSCEHLIDYELYSCDEVDGPVLNCAPDVYCGGLQHMNLTINVLNYYRQKYLETKDKKYWWQMIQLLLSSYNQKRTVMLNYEVLANIYKSRKDHKLDAVTYYADNVPVYSMNANEVQKPKIDIFETLDRIIFPYDPIRDYTEKCIQEINKRF